MGLLDTVGLFGAVILGAPIALLGVEFLVTGRPLAGAGFLAVGIALVAGMHFRPGVTDVAAGLLGGDETPAETTRSNEEADQ
jgi:hypothetical protein